MTREDARDALWSNGHGDSNWIIDQIFNDHETTIEILMKANKEEISRHFNECEKYEAQLKAKDKRIAELEKNNTNLINDVIVLDNDLHRFLSIERKKTRSIVAMLFWKMKRQKKVFQKYYEAYGRNNSLTNCYRGMFEQALMDFNKSRKMLKDNA